MYREWYKFADNSFRQNDIKQFSANNLHFEY